MRVAGGGDDGAAGFHEADISDETNRLLIGRDRCDEETRG